MEATIEDKIYQTFQVWLDAKIELYWQHHAACNLGSRVGSDWEDLLNLLDIRRIEHHLPHRPIQKGCIRMLDPWRLGINRNRDLEMSKDTALKILTLGVPA